ncbi:HU family DNA-binding protein [uncultured Bilophila sp.]|uniref:HU family DNA-binding protein n=1 Tax=uncultured Bilophila sp. TaxID=529385 RepID=UPI0026DC6B10|nr:HU family DNA-binding protein [uncultured Bilophila sp.]
MTKAELIKKWQESESVHHGTAYPVAQLEGLLSSLCDVMASELFGGGEVSLPRFGKLMAVHSKARDARNPKTGEKVHIPARLRVTFRPSKAFKELLN